MPDSVIIAILGLAGTLLGGVIGHVLGQRAERRKQSLMIKAEMVKPIEEWLRGAEKIIGILSDTIASILNNLPLPINYNMDERRSAYNFMAEKTNEVFGIIASHELQIGRTRKVALELNAVITSLDNLIKLQILPRESEIVERANKGTLTQEFILESGQIKVQADAILQNAYSLISRIRTALT
jgi:hypothetical protein